MFLIFVTFYFYLSSVVGVHYNRFFVYMYIFYCLVDQIITAVLMIRLSYINTSIHVLDYLAVTNS